MYQYKICDFSHDTELTGVDSVYTTGNLRKTCLIVIHYYSHGYVCFRLDITKILKNKTITKNERCSVKTSFNVGIIQVESTAVCKFMQKIKIKTALQRFRQIRLAVCHGDTLFTRDMIYGSCK